MRFAISAAILCTTALTLPAHADTVQTFALSGTLSNGTLTGTVDIDTTSGTVGDSTIQLVDGGITYAFLGSPDQYQQAGQLNTTYYGDNIYGPSSTALTFTFPSDLLVGYTGGAICTPSNTACGTFISFDGLSVVAEDSLLTATLLPTPEPSSLLLLGTGVLAAADTVRRRLLA